MRLHPPPVAAPEGQIVQPFSVEDAYTSFAPGSTNCYAVMFVARKDLVASSFLVLLSAAQVTGSLFRLGLYSVAANLSCTLVARSSGAIADAASSGFATIAFNTTGGYPASYSITSESVLAVGVCQNAAGTPPSLKAKSFGGFVPAGGNPMYTVKRSILVGAASDCPTTIAAGQAWGTQIPWIGLV